MAGIDYKKWRRGKAIPVDLVRATLDYDPETGSLTWRHREGAAQFNKEWAHKPAGSRLENKWGKAYLRVRVQGVRYLAHRLAWVIVHGAIPEGMEIDHINGDGLDNRLVNLRLVCASTNKLNTRKPANNSTGRVGVYRHYRRFTARGRLDGRHVHIGEFDTFEEAASARQAWERANGFHENHGSDRPL